MACKHACEPCRHRCVRLLDSGAHMLQPLNGPSPSLSSACHLRPSQQGGPRPAANHHHPPRRPAQRLHSAVLHAFCLPRVAWGALRLLPLDGQLPRPRCLIQPQCPTCLPGMRLFACRTAGWLALCWSQCMRGTRAALSPGYPPTHHLIAVRTPTLPSVQCGAAQLPRLHRLRRGVYPGGQAVLQQ